jgi:glycosyltransferase involved in cell wall biosynthesis
MRLLYVADGRSAIALNWISYFIERGHEVHLASTFHCEAALDFASMQVVPVAFSGLKRDPRAEGEAAGRARRGEKTIGVGLRTRLRQWLGPLTLPHNAARLRTLIEALQPDLVHAMRIPYEGMLAALAAPVAPLLVSVWGNDFTLHAPASALMSRYTRRTLQCAQALHTDCQRDMRLARQWGFEAHKPAVVLPGAGGIQLDIFYPPASGQDRLRASRRLTVINPRGFRAYVRNDTFFRCIPLILKERPDAHFVCPTMAEEPQARRWVADLAIGDHVDLLPLQTRPQMAELFRGARLAVSPSTHDGTPNTLLEAMACGCLPVAGDIESLREWITPGQNGLLFDPGDPQALASAILSGLQDDELCQRAQAINRQLIAERAAYPAVMKAAEEYYFHICKLG